MKKLFYILILVQFTGIAFAGNSDKEKKQEKVVAGKITDSFGESIPGAVITIAETGSTFFTDLEGNYKLTIPADQSLTISINTSGYQPLQLSSKQMTPFSEISLKSL